MNSRIILGEKSYIGGRSIKIVGGIGRIIVGKYSSIADNIQAIFVGHNPNWITTFPFSDSDLRSTWPEAEGIEGHPKFYGDITIGSDVWIGQNVTLIGGITIRDGSIIATGSIVTNNTAPYEIVGGIPAKHIKNRFTYQNTLRLLKIKWWDWPEEKIREAIPLLCSENIDEFINKYN